MKKRFSEEQIVAILREGRSGEKTVEQLCRSHGIAQPTYYGWKRKYGSMAENEVRRLRDLEKENAPLERRAEVLTNIYLRQLRTLGYTEFEFERISLPNGRFLYRLIFCSRAPAGGKIWRGISSKKADGQTTFNFGP